LRGAGRWEEAAASYRQVLALRPASAEAHHRLGLALAGAGGGRGGRVVLPQALRLRPDYPDVYNDLGILLAAAGRSDEAAACYRAALRLQPDYPEAENNLGLTLLALGQPDEAIACYRRVLRRRPHLPDVHLNLGLALLSTGDLEHGWPEYEWRWRAGVAPGRGVEGPRWDGSALDGRAVLLHAEQGLGDTLQFVRYAPLVKRRGGTVVVACPEGLLGLLARTPGIDRVVALRPRCRRSTCRPRCSACRACSGPPWRASPRRCPTCSPTPPGWGTGGVKWAPPLYPEGSSAARPTADLALAAFLGWRRHRLLDATGTVLRTFPGTRSRGKGARSRTCC
jgi:hypothetical protein